MRTITFKRLKHLINEDRYDFRRLDSWGNEVDGAKRWEVSYYYRDSGRYGGTAIISADTRSEARRSFYEDDLAFDRRKVRIGSIRIYEED